ncbi:histidine kinase [Nocardiopsis composta]
MLSVARAIWLDGHWLYLADELPSALLRAGVPWLIAVSLRLYVSLGRRAEQDREHRRRRRVAELKQQVAADRLALAQSLHDDLGHSLSLVALNLGRLEVDPTLPQAARDSLSGARSELARAVERLGDSVVGLRAGAPLAPSHAESADALIHRARTAGARISVRGLPEGAGWRISAVSALCGSCRRRSRMRAGMLQERRSPSMRRIEGESSASGSRMEFPAIS